MPVAERDFVHRTIESYDPTQAKPVRANGYRPAWLFDEDDYEAYRFELYNEFSVAAGETRIDLPIQIPTDSDFHWRAIAISPNPSMVASGPVQIDPSNLQSGFPGAPDANYCGPYIIPGVGVFMILTEANAGVLPPIPGTLSVFFSVSGLAGTWVAQDPLHAPTFPSFITSFQSDFNPVTKIITFVFDAGPNLPSEILRWGTFNCNTRLFTSGVIPDITDWVGGTNFDFAIRANGDIALEYDRTFGATHNLIMTVNSGGVWDAGQIIDPIVANHHKHPATLIPDPATGIIHGVWQDSTPATNTWMYFQLSAANVLSANSAITTSLFLNGDRMFKGRLWNGNTLALPVVRVDPTGTLTEMTVWTGTPLVAPVWTVLPALEIWINVGMTNGNLFVDGANLYACWNIKGGIGVPPDRMRFALNSGAGFGPPSTFYDQVLNPPAGNPAGQQFISDVALGDMGGGALVGAVTMADAAVNLVAWFLPVSGAGQFQVKFKEPVGENPLQDDWVDWQIYGSGPAFPGRFGEEIFCPRGSVISFSIRETTGLGGAQARVTVEGVKQFPRPCS